jgi:hypothetical protein
LNVIMRVLLSVMVSMILIVIVDYYVGGGFLKYLLIGLGAAGISLFNEKQNLKLGKNKVVK